MTFAHKLGAVLSGDADGGLEWWAVDGGGHPPKLKFKFKVRARASVHAHHLRARASVHAHHLRARASVHALHLRARARTSPPAPAQSDTGLFHFRKQRAAVTCVAVSEDNSNMAAGGANGQVGASGARRLAQARTSSLTPALPRSTPCLRP